MKMDVASFDVSAVAAGAESRLVNGVLEVDTDELRDLLMTPGQFADIIIDIVHPGEDVRVVHAVDSVEPRMRTSDPGSDFPGFLSVPATVGKGITHRLSGVAVTTVAPVVPGEPLYWREAIFDMGGSGSRFSPLAQVPNVVLTCLPMPELAASTAIAENIFEGTPEAVEFNRAVREAGLRAAVYLAQTTTDLEPDRVTTYDLAGVDAEGLPKVVYLYQLAIPYVYGDIAPGAGAIGGAAHLPTVIHPNEILDGAVVNGWNAVGCMREATYLDQNHAVIEELYRRHGTDLDFRGVVTFTNGDTSATKERLTSYAAKLAEFLGAEGVVMNYSGGGHPGVDTMMICQKLENMGIKTTLLLMEMAPNPEDSGFVYYVREADAIVSTGNYEEQVELPAVGRVIGGDKILLTDADASGALTLPLSQVYASTHQFGGNLLSAREV